MHVCILRDSMQLCANSLFFKLRITARNCAWLRKAIYPVRAWARMYARIYAPKWVLLGGRYCIHTNPGGRLSGHLQTPGWQPTFCVAWCLIRWFASIEESMFLLRPGAIKQQTQIFPNCILAQSEKVEMSRSEQLMENTCIYVYIYAN